MGAQSIPVSCPGDLGVIFRSRGVILGAMESSTWHVKADWDAEAGVWVATSEDVPGLATEAETIEELTNKLRVMIPELLASNGLLSGIVPAESIAFELTSHRQELVPLAS